MKAKIRKTGEIVDVITYNHCSTVRSHHDYVSYIDSRGIEHDRESLNFYWDFEQIDMQDDNHWQEVRERTAIAIMQGLLADPNRSGCFRDYAKVAIECADILIEELKTNK